MKISCIGINDNWIWNLIKNMVNGNIKVLVIGLDKSNERLRLQYGVINNGIH